MPIVTGDYNFQRPTVVGPFTIATLPADVDDGVFAIVTDDPPSPIYVRIAGVWTSATQAQRTGSAITVTVDFNDPTAIDPPYGLILTSQAQADALLAETGATAFKHLEALWNALPLFVAHNVTFNLAAGVHRPSPGKTGQWGWQLEGKYIYDTVSLIMQGTSPSQWTAETGLANLPVDSFNVGPQTQYLDFSVTNPGIFTGKELRGLFVVLSTGQTLLIDSHTNDRLYVIRTISPSPAGATATICRPSTIIRNSYDDVNTVSYFAMKISGLNDGGNRNIYLDRITYQPIGTLHLGCFQSGHGGGGMRFNYDLIDWMTYTPAGGWTWDVYADAYMSDVSWRSIGLSAADQSVLSGQPSSSLFVYASYFAGGDPNTDGCRLNSFKLARINGVIFDNHYVRAELPTKIQFDDGTVSIGKHTTFRNVASNKAAALYLLNGQISYFLNQNQAVKFEGCACPCVRIGSGVNLLVLGPGFIDGGGNTNVGIWMEGSHSRLELPAANNVTGTLGDVKMADGDIWTYADIVAQGPITDSFFNFLKKS